MRSKQMIQIFMDIFHLDKKVTLYILVNEFGR